MEVTFNNIVAKTATRPCRRIDQRTILAGITGRIKARSVTMVLGPSGAGKTTMLKVLSGRSEGSVNVTGDVQMGGHPAESDIISRNCGYVPQETVLQATLTPRELVMFQCCLRLPASQTQQERADRTEAILKMMSLNECADRRLGGPFDRGASGGERRRVSIALELVDSPAVLFLDEPTTGLDALTSLAVMRSVCGASSGSGDRARPAAEHARASSAKQGCTVIATIHQPGFQLFGLFDSLLLMAKGHVAFCGGRDEAIRFFGHAGFPCPRTLNPAEHLLDLLQCKGGMQAATLDRLLTAPAQAQSMVQPNGGRDDDSNDEVASYAQSIDWQGREEEFSSRRVVAAEPGTLVSSLKSTLWKLCVLTRRAALVHRRTSLLIAANFVQVGVLGGLVACTFVQVGNNQDGVQDRLGAIYFIIICTMFSHTLNVVLTFAEDKAIYTRESHKRLYGAGVYFLSKTSIELPSTALVTIVFCCICYPAMGFGQTWEQFFGFTLVLLLVAFAGQGLGLIVGSTVKDTGVATVMAPMTIGPFILFTSYAMQLSHIPTYLQWLQVLSPFWWSFDALVVNEFSGLALWCTEEQRLMMPKFPKMNEDEGVTSICRYMYGEQVLQHYHIAESAFWPSVRMLVMLVVTFRVVAVLLLKLASTKMCK